MTTPTPHSVAAKRAWSRAAGDLPHDLYIVYANGGQCVYIGCAWNWEDRFVGHFFAMKMGWPRNFDYIDVYTFPTRAEARNAEAWAIWLLQPVENKQHKSKAPVGNRWEREIATVADLVTEPTAAAS